MENLLKNLDKRISQDRNILNKLREVVEEVLMERARTEAILSYRNESPLSQERLRGEWSGLNFFLEILKKKLNL